MQREQLQAVQGPLKRRYQEDPGAALVTLSASGRLDGEGIACSVATGRALVDAGLHPSTGGDGLLACSGDMLLQALVACAGVTLPPWPPRWRSRSPAPCTPRVCSTCGAPSASTGRPQWGSERSRSASTSTATRPRSRSPLCCD